MEDAKEKQRVQVAKEEKGMKSRGQPACDLWLERETDGVRVDWSAVQTCWKGILAGKGWDRVYRDSGGWVTYTRRDRGRRLPTDMKPDSQALPQEPV